MAEIFNWGLFFKGFIDPVRILKDGGTLIRMILILAICVACYLGIKQVNNMIGKKPTPTSTISEMSGGYVENVGTKTKQFKLGVLNF
jgi:hypothetical protein